MSVKVSGLVFAMVMVFSSFVGCIDTEEDSNTSTVSDDSTTGDSSAVTNSTLGTVMTSTYHVAELARGVGGDRVTVELISSSAQMFTITPLQFQILLDFRTQIYFFITV